MAEDKDITCCVKACDQPLDKTYWNTQWENEQIGWDIGYAAPAIVAYMQQYPNKEARILIAGCGNAYEAEALCDMGFKHITLVDIAPKAVLLLQEKFADKPEINVVLGDFFEHEGQYDLMIEQTFFCAIPPGKRTDYAQQARKLLSDKGKIIGLLFDRRFEQQGPPFGGCPCEYKPVFNPYFEIKTMDLCTNSIKPREHQEVFIILNKKDNE
ncbi:SAM-dependent methyltransferase [Taibaiella sp. KBW10]|uniref:methyltransferase domain-containing protein n=1 Tax=Taibaiella sp. KBW10 TaxID=2153357 RepID=UPI000F5A63B8|nr:methyltransferase domain-containing protein [Taibaiella sp. KBW10]RQO32449.1 SAM-dependent methyltransferase [Taibaiella sp. KBW10]